MMEQCQIFTKWTKEFGDEMVAKYPYCKKVYLSQDSNYIHELTLLDTLNQNSILETIETKEELECLLSQNFFFPFSEGIDASFRQGHCSITNGKVKIENCVIFLLYKDEKWYNRLADEFPEQVTVENFTLTFPKKVGCEELKAHALSLIDKIANQPLTIRFDSSTLTHFFKNAVVLYSGTIAPDEVRVLRKATNHPSYAIRGKKKKVLFLFTGSAPISIEEISKIITDSLFYLGAHAYSDYIYGTCIDCTCTNTKVDLLVVTEGDEI